MRSEILTHTDHTLTWLRNLWSRQEEHAAGLGQLEELKKLLREADTERAGLLAARARENEERAGEWAEREQLADDKARLEGEVLARDGERARLAALEGELTAAQNTIAELRGALQSQDRAAAALLQEARGAQMQAEEEVRALRAAAAAEAQELTQLLEAVGLPPEGDWLARLGAAVRQVREAQGLCKKMEHKVQVLEALRVENDEVIKQLRAQIAAAQEQLPLQQQPLSPISSRSTPSESLKRPVHTLDGTLPVSPPLLFSRRQQTIPSQGEESTFGSSSEDEDGVMPMEEEQTRDPLDLSRRHLEGPLPLHDTQSSQRPSQSQAQRNQPVANMAPIDACGRARDIDTPMFCTAPDEGPSSGPSSGDHLHETDLDFECKYFFRIAFLSNRVVPCILLVLDGGWALLRTRAAGMIIAVL